MSLTLCCLGVTAFCMWPWFSIAHAASAEW